MTTWTITGFNGVNNMQDPSALVQPKVVSKNGDGAGPCDLIECINFDIDDNGGLVSRDPYQKIFTKSFDAKFKQVLRGRTYTVANNVLTYTKPFSLEVDPKRCNIYYPATITMIQEVENGMWVSTTEKIYFHKGHNPTELGDFSQSTEYTFPAIMGTGEKLAASKMLLQRDGFVVIFATTFGICMGTDDGIITNLSEASFSYAPGQRGISYIKEDGGMIQYIVKMINPQDASYNAQDIIEDTQALEIDSQ